MSFGGSIGKEFEKINKRRDKIIASASLNLYGDLVEVSPVDTGELRISWQLPKKIGRAKYVITNIAPHALVIDGGIRRVPVAGGGEEVIGSWQLPKGFKPTIKKTEKALEKAFK